MQAKVTILTVALNSEKTIARTIESVLAQTYDNLEYIILDGQSTDKTVSIAESYRKAFENRKIDYIVCSEKDNGMYHALNKGVAMARGVIIGSVNSDDYLEPEAAEVMAKTYETTGFDMAYANLRIIKPTGTMIKRAKFSSFVSTRYWNHPTTFIAKSVYDKEKYKLESLYDDCDLMLRLRKKGYKVVTIDKVLSNFVFGGMSTKKSLKETVGRIKTRCKIYKNNGYGFIYYFDCFAIEMAKWILG